MSPRRKIKIVRPDKYCKNCGKRISPGRNGRRDHCNDACKQAAYRKRRAVVTPASGKGNEAERSIQIT